jgi:hypothetical protein
MKTATVPPPAAANESRADGLRGNFVMLRADGLRLLLPQHEVGAAEYVDGTVQPAGAGGFFSLGEGADARTVVALSGRLRPLAQWPTGRFVLTRLESGAGELSLAWNEARVLIDAHLELHPLPPVLRVPGAPLQGYVEHAGELVFCTTARAVVEAALAGS